MWPRNKPLITNNNVLWLMWFYSTSKSSYHEKGKNPGIYNCLFNVWVELLFVITTVWFSEATEKEFLEVANLKVKLFGSHQSLYSQRHKKRARWKLFSFLMETALFIMDVSSHITSQSAFKQMSFLQLHVRRWDFQKKKMCHPDCFCLTLDSLEFSLLNCIKNDEPEWSHHQQKKPRRVH